MPSVLKTQYEILLVFITLGAAINSFWIKCDIWQLNENQILYIYSALAQVVGALLGITIAGYAVVDQKNKKMKESDDSIEEYVDRISENQFALVKKIIWLSVFSLALCFGVLASYRMFDRMVSFGMTEAILLLGIIIFALLEFSAYLSPDTIKVMGSKDKAMYDEQKIETNDKYAFPKFITFYNQLEEIIKFIAANRVDSPELIYKLQIREAISILLDYRIINYQTQNVIQEIRMYRNALVHSSEDDKNVSNDMYERLLGILSYMRNIKACIVEGKDYDVYVEKLSEYTSNLKMTKAEEKMLDFIHTHHSVSLSEISEYIGFSNKATLNKLYQLMNMNKVTKVGSGRFTKWQYVKGQREDTDEK